MNDAAALGAPRGYSLWAGNIYFDWRQPSHRKLHSRNLMVFPRELSRWSISCGKLTFLWRDSANAKV
jgi:hypothetical protein